LLTKDFSLPREFPDREIYPDLAREGLTVFDLHNKAAVEQQQVWYAARACHRDVPGIQMKPHKKEVGGPGFPFLLISPVESRRQICLMTTSSSAGDALSRRRHRKLIILRQIRAYPRTAPPEDAHLKTMGTFETDEHFWANAPQRRSRWWRTTALSRVHRRLTSRPLEML
jgi:hypothetical protein